MEFELGGVSAVRVAGNRIEIRERRAEGFEDIVINVPASFAPSLIAELQELVSENSERVAK
jgi:hypothetical protein